MPAMMIATILTMREMQATTDTPPGLTSRLVEVATSHPPCADAGAGALITKTSGCASTATTPSASRRIGHKIVCHHVSMEAVRSSA
mmetsp:Transcript_9039/g.20407  ORF Transcript_9039/g.20407 Transcript_9039/m.20407 type:complete len:86 (-) Transcript_9039:391-648(-)